MYTVVPTKSDSDVIVCLQLLSETLTCTLHTHNVSVTLGWQDSRPRDLRESNKVNDDIIGTNYIDLAKIENEGEKGKGHKSQHQTSGCNCIKKRF